MHLWVFAFRIINQNEKVKTKQEVRIMLVKDLLTNHLVPSQNYYDGIGCVCGEGRWAKSGNV